MTTHSGTRTDTAPTAHAGRYVLASRPLLGWRTVDILTIAFLGVAIGIAMWGWGILYNGPLTALGFTFRPELGYDDPDYPPHDNPTTVWSLDAPA